MELEGLAPNGNEGYWSAIPSRQTARSSVTIQRAVSLLTSAWGTALGIDPNIDTHKAARRTAPALGLFLPLVCLATSAIIGTVAPLASVAGHFGFMSSAMAETGGLTKRQSDALDAYNNALKKFESLLTQRRAQLGSNQRLPDLPGQLLYLARNDMISAYKDLTDALPSRIGRPNKFKIPPAYLDAEAEPLLDEYRKLFDRMEAPPANAQKSDTPFK